MSIIAEAPGFLQVFSDGSVKRFSPEIASPTTEFFKSFQSKDIIVDSSKPITGRIFRPELPTIDTTKASHNTKLPVVVYFHGGGFCIGSTTWLGYHVFLGDLASKARVIVLSIDYRLAPENRLPIAYSDGYSSLEWLAKMCNSDPWLEQADLSRVFLAGDSAGGNIAHNVAIATIKNHIENVHIAGSAGGNIAHNVAIATIKNHIDNVHIAGILLIHPFFGSEARSPKEMVDEEATEVRMNDMFWGLSIPEGLNRDYFGCNFEKVELGDDQWRRFPKVVVYVAGLDFLMERGVMYAEYMRSKGVKGVELIEAKEENHVYHVYFPLSEATQLLQQQMAGFIHNL